MKMALEKSAIKYRSTEKKYTTKENEIILEKMNHENC